MEEVFSPHLIGQISKESPTPLYHQLFSLLKSRILDGTLALGLRLPPEEQLADLFSVSRITAKRAMDDLATEGLVERRRGRGTPTCPSILSIFKISPGDTLNCFPTDFRTAYIMRCTIYIGLFLCQ
jgi:DNA-binding FadR family transcriptional regulator